MSHFDDVKLRLIDVDPHVIRSIVEVFKITRLTDIQDKCLSACLGGKDVLAKSKTGTGIEIGTKSYSNSSP